MAASEKEALEVAEIEECDQKYLSELKSSIAEQRCLTCFFLILECTDKL